MSRRNRPVRRPVNTATAPRETGGAARPDDAEAALGAARYREAIELYKGRLKRERRAEWIEGLAAAYAGRAAQLAAKGMAAEALALCRTRADLCGTPLFDGTYLDLLLRAGETGQALHLFAGASNLASETRTQMETQLAPVTLAAPDGALAELPADSPLVRHRAQAKAALAAFARGDDSAMAEGLQAIPFRSPYRDLRALLKALALHVTDPAQAAQALGRVPAEGPFEPLLALLRVCVLPDQGWIAALRGLDAQRREAVLDLKGCPPGQRALVLELVGLGDNPAPATLFDALARHRRALPEDAAGALCRGLLPRAAERLRAYAASFGLLPYAEEQRVLALAAEQKGALEEAEAFWLHYVECVRADPVGRRRAALVLRRLSELPAHRNADGSACEHALAWWAQSLELDPECRATHLKLIRALRGHSDLKEARARLDAALARFPNDADVLLEAVETALAGGAFKKAAGIAKRVLELDPINPRVRAVVGQAHLSHARKQIVGRNPVLARRELDQAAQWLRTTADRASIKLLRGLIEEPGEAGDALLREGLAELGGTLIGIFHLLLEAWRTKRDHKAVLRRLGIDLGGTPPAGEIVALAHALNATAEFNAVRAAFGSLREMLGRGAAASFSESDQLLVCEALRRHHQHDLVRRYAEAALRRWPGRPVFVYLQAAAAYGAQPWRIPAREQKALEQALAVAEAQGEQRTALRLRDLLSEATGSFAAPDEDGPAGLDAWEDADPRPMLEALLASFGADKFIEIVRGQVDSKAFETVRRTIGGDNKKLARALVDLIAYARSLPGLGGSGAPPRSPAAGRASSGRELPRAQPEQKDLFDD